MLSRIAKLLFISKHCIVPCEEIFFKKKNNMYLNILQFVVQMTKLCLFFAWEGVEQRQSADSRRLPVCLQTLFVVRWGQHQKHMIHPVFRLILRAVDSPSVNYREKWSYDIQRAEVKPSVFSLFLTFYDFFSLFLHHWSIPGELYCFPFPYSGALVNKSAFDWCIGHFV